MENGLKLWKVREWLEPLEAVCLILGIDANVMRVDVEEAPVGFGAVLVELQLSLLRYQDIKLENERGNIEPYEEIFTPYNISGFFDEKSLDPYNFVIRQSAIKAWVYAKGIESEYFSSLDNHVKTDVIARPEYQTKLMAIMYATIERYYGENYDPNDSDTAPKQTDVIGWIRKKYSLSEAKAKAVEKMTRPD